jgi:hypothetical protein
MTATDLTEQTSRIAARVEDVRIAMETLCPEKSSAVGVLTRAVGELLVEVLSSATVMAAQSVLPAYGIAALAKEEAEKAQRVVKELQTVVRETRDRLDELEVGSS